MPRWSYFQCLAAGQRATTEPELTEGSADTAVHRLPWHIIDPDSTLNLVWDMVSLVLLVYVTR